MRYALISDIHSNTEALEAVLKDAHEQKAESYLCLGDIVGYGAEPSACLERVRGLNGTVIAGNHDYAVCEKTDTSYFNTYARKAVQWTMQQLSKTQLEYLGKLPLVYESKNYCLAHGSLNGPENWEYILAEEDAMHSFELLKQRILFVGHSHVPFIFTLENGQVSGAEPHDFTLSPGAKYIVNIGSVGQPRDMDNRASYCIFDEEKSSVHFRRIPYDFRSTQKKILDAKLPELLALRLELGR
jgi:predicted phosphodiesterase